ncbi:type VI secretion system tip protein VgrG, partial [Pseudomonas citronellolis]|nr:type VI secretion system tip protein VgrG [Pseudomonas citronellolis]
NYYRDDFSGTEEPRDRALFMHELTHVWQWQLGYSVKWQALWVTSRGAKAYEYDLKSGGKFSDYNMEQQGEIVSDYYMICIENKPAGVWSYANATKDPALLASTIKDLLSDPKGRLNLPR